MDRLVMPALMSAPSTGRKASGARATGLATLGEARMTLRDQIDGHLLHSSPSTEVLRARIQTLLPLSMQRELFLWLASRGERGLAVCASLFGAPPYAFLRPGDAAALTARGFAHGRVRMAYENASGPQAPNYAQFGIPHYEDAQGRQLRFMQPDNSSLDSPTCVLALLHASDAPVTFALRLPRKRRAAALVETPVLFPSPNARLRLRLQSAVRTALGEAANAVAAVEICVLRIQLASVMRGAPCARDAVAILEARVSRVSSASAPEESAISTVYSTVSTTTRVP